LGVTGEGQNDTGSDLRHLTPFHREPRTVPSSLSFYGDRLGFEITFQGPDPDDIFFGIVRRGGAMIMLKDVGVVLGDPRIPAHERKVRYSFACGPRG